MRIVPERRIRGISAVFLPFREGRPDYAGFEEHLLRTVRAGLEPAVNMDTGFGPQISSLERREILAITRRATHPFVAGALPPYDESLKAILDHGGTPILFQSDEINADPVAFHRRMAAPALAFELGPMFAPFGRIYDLETFRRILDIPMIVGLKHSSLSRELEWERLELRNRARSEFKIYTGNDLAIDMVMYGSDYLLGLSTFDPEAFALRDRFWLEGDPRFHALNDALQALGTAAFRDPVPAYKDSAAIYLGRQPHPSCPRRPEGEAERLRPLRRRILDLMS